MCVGGGGGVGGWEHCVGVGDGKKERIKKKVGGGGEAWIQSRIETISIKSLGEQYLNHKAIYLYAFL